MHMNVNELRNFYFNTQLGNFVSNVIAERILTLWPDLQGLTVLGYGYAPPLIDSFTEAYRQLILMPAEQGVLPCKGSKGNISVKTAESQWPLPTGVIDRVILLHGLETSNNTTALIDECWRVLTPEGILMAIVPNRAGMWARKDYTPFGNGRPYSASQIENVLNKGRFLPARRSSALYAPPGKKGSVTRFTRTIEKTAARVPCGIVAGIHIVEAKKRVFSKHRPGITETVRTQLAHLKGVRIPDPRPASGRVS